MSGPKWMLVVDDSEAEGEIVANTLGAAFPEAEIRHATDPLQVAEMCAAYRFDCVMLDYNMPELDGLALAARLRATAPHLPMVLMTSVGNEMLAAEALRNGVSDYLPKARISVDSLRRVVTRSIHSSAQAQLIDQQRSELENFAYALAHDFKQPIRQINTFSQLLTEDLGNRGSVKARQHLAFLSDAAQRLSKLVDVMSQYTLLNQPPQLAEVDLKRVLNSVEVWLAPYVAERDGELVIPENAPVVHGNETLLTQVLQNLVVNGLKFNRSPVPRVEVSAEHHGDHWILQVQDNGIGIEQQYLDDIFKPLIRLHTAAQFPGSGFGLALARKAVLAQNGAIWCESVPGQGSVFKIRLQPAAAVQRRRRRVERLAALEPESRLQTIGL